MSVHQIEKLWREVGLPEYFLGNGSTNTKLYALYDAIRGPNPKPIFEHGKQYRTRCGKVTGPLYADPCLSAEGYQLVGLVDGANKTWTPAGRYTTHGEGPLDLMPGAIGDEAIADLGIGMKVRLDAMQRQIDGLRSDLVANLEATDKRIASLLDVVKDQQSAIKSVISAANDQQSALRHQQSALTNHESRFDNHRERLRNHVDRISKLEEPRCGTESAAHTSAFTAAPKRTIKGGWVNVFTKDGESVHGSSAWPSREDALRSVTIRHWAMQQGWTLSACIQIPDITEGQGL